MTTTREIYAKFRLSIDNGFRNEFSYVSYRRWGAMEVWEGGRYRNPCNPSTTKSGAGIEVWFNWELIGTYKSYDEARGMIGKLLLAAPAALHDLEQYLDI